MQARVALGSTTLHCSAPLLFASLTPIPCGGDAGLQASAAQAAPLRAGFSVGGSAANDSDAAGLSIEESKFMGGDVEHTHLVKGLDFALLQKVRAEQAVRDEDVAKEQAEAQRAAATAASAVVHTSLGRALHSFVTGAHPACCLRRRLCCICENMRPAFPPPCRRTPCERTRGGAFRVRPHGVRVRHAGARAPQAPHY
jgi:hypothetical protein